MLRPLSLWMAWAKTSLPVPLSPLSRMLAVPCAALRAVAARAPAVDLQPFALTRF